MIAYLMVAACVLMAAGLGYASWATTRRRGEFTLSAHALRALAIGFLLTGGSWASALTVALVTA